MIDIKAIREAAEAATPGPWEYRELEWGNYVTADGLTSVCRSALSSTASMKHIATANPATVLALCDEIERLKDLLGKANALCRIRADEIERLQLDAEKHRLRVALAQAEIEQAVLKKNGIEE